MKRFVILVTAFFLCISGFVFAEESVLIDFADLVRNYDPENASQLDEAEDPKENMRTLIDFGEKAGTGFSAEEKRLMMTSLAVPNWEVELASSSQTITNMANSMTKQVTVNEDAQKEEYRGVNVMGIRIHFPTGDYNSWAIVRPPFEIPFYMQRTNIEQNDEGDYVLVSDPEDVNRTKFDNFGVVKNVGVLKSVSMNVLGLNYPMGCEIVLEDQNSREMSLFMGYLWFDGWRTLQWENPGYIAQVRDRELQRYPLYPRATPSVKLVGIRFLRDKEQIGGDFITYIKDISITYDKAVLDLDMDVNNEEVWGILENREEGRREAEFFRLGELQVLRALEKKKMHQVDNAGAGADEGGEEN